MNSCKQCTKTAMALPTTFDFALAMSLTRLSFVSVWLVALALAKGQRPRGRILLLYRRARPQSTPWPAQRHPHGSAVADLAPVSTKRRAVSSNIVSWVARKAHRSLPSSHLAKAPGTETHCRVLRQLVHLPRDRRHVSWRLRSIAQSSRGLGGFRFRAETLNVHQNLEIVSHVPGQITARSKEVILDVIDRMHIHSGF